MRQKHKVPRFHTIVRALVARTMGTRCQRLEHRVNKAWAMRDQRLFTEGPTREHNKSKWVKNQKAILHPFYYLFLRPADNC